MNLLWFHLMPYTDLPEDFRDKHPSIWVDIDSRLFDPARAHVLYNDFIDELEYAAELGFDGVCVNEHHATGYGLMPSPNLIASVLARSTRQAARRRVVAPSLPGFPGTTAIGPLYSHLDWLLATRDLITRAGLKRCDLMGVSLGAALAADVAGVWPDLVDRLVLVSALGLFDEKEPNADPFAQRPGELPKLLCADPERYLAHTARPEGADPVEWTVMTTRAHEAAARLLWPLGDTGLAGRLDRIEQDTLLVWGAADRVVPASYRERFSTGIAGNTQLDIVEGAGHLVDLDAPAALTQRVGEFLRRRSDKLAKRST